MRAHDLEGIVAKRLDDPYDPRTKWLKIKNPDYLAEGRERGAVQSTEIGRRKTRRVRRWTPRLIREWQGRVAAPNCHILEVSQGYMPMMWELFNEPFDIRPDGMVHAPDRPGLGFTLRADALERFRYVDGPEYEF
jgi:hypothetical protein